ncbi:MAG: DUF4156 domain-containing protein [Dyella sp.]
MFVRMGLLAVIASLAVGCVVAPSQSARQVQDADQAMVAGCRYVGDVAGWSGWGGLASGAGMANAQSDARDKAARLGASHIVWSSVAAGYTPSASGKAYRCDRSAG